VRQTTELLATLGGSPVSSAVLTSTTTSRADQCTGGKQADCSDKLASKLAGKQGCCTVMPAS
jgi:hypothetical protein